MFPKKKLNEFELEHAMKNNIDVEILANENLCFEAIARLKLIEKVQNLQKDDSLFHNFAIEKNIRKYNEINYEDTKIIRQKCK